MDRRIFEQDPVCNMGYSEKLIAFQKRFALQKSTNFLIPYLEPGQKLLDVGCGAPFSAAGQSSSPGRAARRRYRAVAD